jgi:hypothetical protein
MHSSLPNIPRLGTLRAEGLNSSSNSSLGWTRIEALNVRSQILATVASTRRNMRKASLIRRARDSTLHSAKSSSSFASSMWRELDIGGGSGGRNKRMGGAAAG